MSNLLLARAAIAAVWIYQGLWCKLLGRMPHHQEIVGTVPLLTPARAHRALVALGLLECVIGSWVLSGFWPSEAALLQTALLVAMNAGGLLWASRAIPDPVGMLLQNFAFLLLAWIAAGSGV
jgi:uncharacterized membrane protein YphA (DoxX/SURF4 family)